MVIFGMCEKTIAQSRWVGIMPMEFNPSFAGNSGENRCVAFGAYTNSRSGFKSIGPNRYKYFRREDSPTISFSYDNFISKLASGIGFYMSWIKSISGTRNIEYPYTNFTALKMGINISPKISIRGKYTIAPSIGLNYRYLRYINVPGARIDYLVAFKSDIFYISTGLLFNTKNFYIGYTYYLGPVPIGDRYRSFDDESYPADKPYNNIQAGYKYQKNKESKTSYTIQAVISMKRKFDWSDLVNNVAFVFKYKKILLGIAHADGYNLGIGYQSGRVRFFYSQDITNVRYVYHGELSCRVIIPNKRKIYYQF